MEINETPYVCHLFVCAKSRDGIRRSCGDKSNGQLKAILKDEIKKRGWKSRVRVSETGCMGLCNEGPNVMIYPQQIWYSSVSLSDAPTILETVETLLEHD